MRLGIDWIAVVAVVVAVGYLYVLPALPLAAGPAPPRAAVSYDDDDSGAYDADWVDSTPPPPPPGKCETRPVAPEELLEHATADDLWLVFDGMVVDVTDFLARHPGGPSILAAYAVRDVADIVDAESSFAALALALHRLP
ncbi:uncharacterized protein AMSG_01073 [Thecamonas trahens ATCC 50062]|uniref:Cytochrome b5 heme-binding domain-containing protein n=1 Tax=Thecamonas trahens ATCC 50062 TaxID=461836 RepID=A0A0L0DIN0_THETB|nr:hypothetical protein AMSG_01073 [Thecamonas trahens ATCC 50062]KNC52244.1 hypothetical protein AMSG_01073 [Thecamonas trahens ATCC 50062]|eukprot:XP_013762246.1 hypothetical protein AMSG_01073 [Thecamonas trahens ATCC 50062]